ncbi:MAG: site-2 protease family protein [Candidatus Hodarchaeota archaeon]
MLQLEFLLPWLPWILILLVWVIILSLASMFNLEKYRLEVGPFMLFWRTERFNNLLDRIGRWNPRAWRYIWSGFIGFAFFFSLYGFYFLFLNVWEFVKGLLGIPGGTPGAVAPLIPGVTMPYQTFLMILIPLIVAILFHELAHGIAARADDIPVKSSGIFAFLIFFGAFVEPDEEYVKIKTTHRQRARLYASGSGVNIAVALAAIALMTLMIIPAPSGVLIQNVVPGSAADGALAPGMVITGMNGTAVQTSEDLGLFMDNTEPGDLVVFTVNGDSIPIVVGTNPSNASQAYIGIYLSTYFPLHFPFSLLGPIGGIEFQRGLLWFIMITFSLGVINLLPIPPLDGDRLWKELIDVTISLERKSGRALLWGLRIAALGTLIANIVFTIMNPALLLMFFG